MIEEARQQKIAEIKAMVARRYPNMSERNRTRLVGFYVTGFEDGVKAAMAMQAQRMPR